MNLRDKLNIYTKPEVKETNSLKEFSLSSIGGEEIETDYGKIWRIENRININEPYNGIDFSNLFYDIIPLLKFNKLPIDLKIEDLIFFDLETTSLNIGAGNYPFLIGIGYIDDKDLIIEQLFMKEYSDEIAILNYILPFFQKARAGVSFNGKTFDFPLLKTRFMLNKVYDFPVNLTMVDLIIPSRRIFKSIFENCALQTLEKKVLGFERIDDTPGWMIPDIYFTFQKEGTWEKIPGIIEHNKIDIASMYFLTFLLSEIFSFIDKGDFYKINKGSLFNIGRHLFRIDMEVFLDLMEYLDMDIVEDEGILKKFSISLKRDNQWEKAIKYWEKSSSIFSLTELAKYYEHKKKNFIKAKKYCLQAIEMIDKNNYSPKEKLLSSSKKKYEKELKKRLLRIEQKIQSYNFN